MLNDVKPTRMVTLCLSQSLLPAWVASCEGIYASTVQVSKTTVVALGIDLRTYIPCGALL